MAPKSDDMRNASAMSYISSDNLCSRHGRDTCYAVCIPPDVDGIARENLLTLTGRPVLSSGLPVIPRPPFQPLANRLRHSF